MKRVTAVLLVAGVLAGCASASSHTESPWLVQRELKPPRQCEPLTADQELVRGLSREMAAAGRRHAALANLEPLPEGLPQVRLDKARLLRQLGHAAEAEVLYDSLLDSCLVADARHGLGQIEAARQNYPQAREHLRAAASLAPANAAIRNDLGVVYLNQRQLAEARFELLTALELNENSQRAAQNLLTLLVYQGRWQAARELVNARGLSSEQFTRAEQRARALRSSDLAAQPAGQPLTRAAPQLVAPPVPAPVPAPAAQPRPPARVPAPPAVVPAMPLRQAAAALAPAGPVAAAEAEQPVRLGLAARVWAVEEAADAASTQRHQQGANPLSSGGSSAILCRPVRRDNSSLSIMECLPE